MNGIILYQSKYGAAKKYATRISEETAVIDGVVKHVTIISGGGEIKFSAAFDCLPAAH